MIRLEERRTPFGDISIIRRRATGVLVYEQSGSCQSEADANGVSLASYVHAIYGLCLQSDTRTHLMIGCGGGTLGTMLARAGRKVAIVDVSAEAFALARRYFGLSDRIECHVADGYDYLQRQADRYDVVILDAFHGDRMPSHLRSTEFFALVKRRLAPRGCLFVNAHVADDNDRSADDLARHAADVWTEVRLLDAPGYCNRNAILLAGNVAQLTPPALLVRPSISADEIAFELGSMRIRQR